MVDIPNPTPKPRSTPAAIPAATALSTEAETMFTQFKALDPSGAGVDLKKMRVFYPRTGWNVILSSVRELEDAGRLTKKAVLNNKGTVAYHVYTWKEA